MHVDVWAVLDLVQRQGQVKAQSGPLGLAEGDGRDEHPAAIEFKEASPRVDDQITDNPAIIVKQEIQHVSDVAIGRAHRVPFQVSKAPQHGISALRSSSVHTGSTEPAARLAIERAITSFAFVS